MQITNSSNGAVEYLCGVKPFFDRSQFPYLTFVITDLNMPGGDGFTVLEYLRVTPHSAVIPTIVLSAFTDSDDIKRAYSLGASAYLAKPTDVLVFTAIIQSLIAFWMIGEVPEVNLAGVQRYTESTGKLGERFIVL